MLEVDLSQTQARPGERVRARVRCHGTGPVSAVRLLVEEGGTTYDWPLEPEGDAWVAEAAVPWDAPPGTYGVSFVAYGPDGRPVDTSWKSFTVL